MASISKVNKTQDLAYFPYDDSIKKNKFFTNLISFCYKRKWQHNDNDYSK